MTHAWEQVTFLLGILPRWSAFHAGHVTFLSTKHQHVTLQNTSSSYISFLGITRQHTGHVTITRHLYWHISASLAQDGYFPCIHAWCMTRQLFMHNTSFCHSWCNTNYSCRTRQLFMHDASHVTLLYLTAIIVYCLITLHIFHNLQGLPDELDYSA